MESRWLRRWRHGFLNGGQSAGPAPPLLPEVVADRCRCVGGYKRAHHAFERVRRAGKREHLGGLAGAELPGGAYRLVAHDAEFVDAMQPLTVAGTNQAVNVQFTRVAPHSDTVTATADVSDLAIENPDPAQRVLMREELLASLRTAARMTDLCYLPPFASRPPAIRRAWASTVGSFTPIWIAA